MRKSIDTTFKENYGCEKYVNKLPNGMYVITWDCVCTLRRYCDGMVGQLKLCSDVPVHTIRDWQVKYIGCNLIHLFYSYVTVDVSICNTATLKIHRAHKTIKENY